MHHQFKVCKPLLKYDSVDTKHVKLRSCLMILILMLQILFNHILKLNRLQKAHWKHAIFHLHLNSAIVT